MREEWKKIERFLEKDPEAFLREELHAGKIVDEIKVKGGRVAWSVKQEGALPRPNFDMHVPGEHGVASISTSWGEYVQILKKNFEDDLAVSTNEEHRQLLQQALVCVCYLEAAEANTELTDTGPAAYMLGQLAQQNREYLDSSKTLARGVKNYEGTSSGGKASRRIDHQARVAAVEDYRQRNSRQSRADAFRNVAKAHAEEGWTESGLKRSWQRYGPGPGKRRSRKK